MTQDRHSWPGDQHGEIRVAPSLWCLQWEKGKRSGQDL